MDKCGRMGGDKVKERKQVTKVEEEQTGRKDGKVRKKETRKD